MAELLEGSTDCVWVWWEGSVGYLPSGIRCPLVTVLEVFACVFGKRGIP